MSLYSLAKPTRAMNFGEFVDGKPQQPLPEVLSSRLADLASFEGYCNKLMLKILTLFAIGLDVSHISLSLTKPMF
jgi:hypothetical protein